MKYKAAIKVCGTFYTEVDAKDGEDAVFKASLELNKTDLRSILYNVQCVDSCAYVADEFNTHYKLYDLQKVWRHV